VSSQKDLNAIFEPRSVAVIGASREPGSVGYAVLDGLINGDFTGVVYPVNPKARAIRGVRAYASINDVPDEVDLAVIVVPARVVPTVLAECGQKGVKGAIVISAGFKETGREGAALETEVKAIASRHRITLVGPNCLGVLNTATGVRLNASFAKAMPAPGHIAFISQSGALCTAVLDYARGQQIGFSKVVSMGNKADANENDFLRYLWHDPQTRVILLYLEDLAEGRAFIELAREITGEGVDRKPILALKSGRTPQGARAVSSHTGSLAGSDNVYDAVFMQGGVMRVETVEDLFDYAIAFANQPAPKNKRIAVITNAGGPGIMATDASIRYGLEMANFTEETVKRLRAALPPHAAIGNPVDVIGDARHDRYQVALDIVLQDTNTDGVIVLLTPQNMTEIEETARVVVEASARREKPIFGCFMGVVDVSAGVRILAANGVPAYTFPEDAVRAFAAMARYSNWVNRPRTEIKTFPVDRERAHRLLSDAPHNAFGFISEEAAMQVLEAYGFPLLPWGVAHSADAAADVARRVGLPVVLKVLSPDIVHKFDVGGVRLNLRSEDDVRHAFTAMMKEIPERQPGVTLDGVLVQAMVRNSREVLLGMKQDPQFGPVIVFGLGGIYVEVLKDVTFRVAPLREFSAERMVRSIRAYELLEGVRGEPPADIEAIAECIKRLSQLAVEQPFIEELDINPLMVLPQGQGAFVADVRIAVSLRKNA
jgi:acetyltransferase